MLITNDSIFYYIIYKHIEKNMSENQDKIKFERTDKGTWSKIVENKTQGTHDNSIVIVTDDNLIYTQGTHIGASLGNSQNNTIFFKDIDENIPNEVEGFEYVITNPQILNETQKYNARKNIGALGRVESSVYEINNEDDYEKEIYMYEHIIKLNINKYFNSGTFQPSFVYTDKDEVSIIVENKTENIVMMPIGGDITCEGSENKFISKVLNNKTSISIPSGTSIEINYMFVDNEARIIILS